MPTRDDYERLILHELQEGDVVRVPVRDSNEYHAQRMTVFRLLKTLKAQGVNVGHIATRKLTKDNQIHLEIEHLSADDPKFIFVTPDGEEERTISRDLKTREDIEFDKWMADVKRLEEQDKQSS